MGTSTPCAPSATSPPTRQRAKHTGAVLEVEPGEAEFLLDVLGGSLRLLVRPASPPAQAQREAVAAKLQGRSPNPSPPSNQASCGPTAAAGPLPGMNLQQLRRLDTDAEAAVRRMSIVKLAAT